MIPDSDKSYNFVIGLLYTQIFQELYYQADFKCGGRLPVHVTFMLDEFCNVALPDDFCSLLSTMRSREISSVMIIQNLAQIKALFKDTCETIPGNSDTLVYLGGNEAGTHEYISKMLGKATIDKKSSGETRGRQGSSSRNYDVLGREIMTPDEVRKMDNRKCLVFVRGFDPILDDKYFTPKHPMFEYSGDGKFGEPYEHEAVTEGSIREPEFFVLSEQSVKYYEKLAADGEEVYIDTLSYEEFMMLDEWDVQHRFTEMAEQEDKEQYYSDAGAEVIYDMEPEDLEDTEDTGTGGSSFFTGQAGRKAGNAPLTDNEKTEPEDVPEQPEDSISYRMLHMGFTKEQKTEVMRALAAKVPKEVILSYFYPETSVMRMRELRGKYGQG